MVSSWNTESISGIYSERPPVWLHWFSSWSEWNYDFNSTGVSGMRRAAGAPASAESCFTDTELKQTDRVWFKKKKKMKMNILFFFMKYFMLAVFFSHHQNSSSVLFHTAAQQCEKLPWNCTRKTMNEWNVSFLGLNETNKKIKAMFYSSQSNIPLQESVMTHSVGNQLRYKLLYTTPKLVNAVQTFLLCATILFLYWPC